jgi:hypothetical protein
MKQLLDQSSISINKKEASERLKMRHLMAAARRRFSAAAATAATVTQLFPFATLLIGGDPQI